MFEVGVIDGTLYTPGRDAVIIANRPSHHTES
jgi:hypothetical protein